MNLKATRLVSTDSACDMWIQVHGMAEKMDP